MSMLPQTHPLLDPFVPACSSWAIVTAVSSGLIEALGQEVRGAGDLARDLSLDEAGVDRLLRALVHLGYVEAEGELYRLADVARQCLTTTSPHRLASWVRFCRIQLLALSRLEQTLSTGRGVDLYDLMTTREELRVHQMAMAETAMPMAEWVASRIPVPSTQGPILDIGGSHGLYSAAICRHNPPLRAEAMELPGVIDEARSVAHQLGTSDHVIHIEGDILQTSLDKDYSVAFLGNLIHHLPPQQLAAALERITGHLVPGGTVAIWDIAETKGEGDLVSSLFSLLFYLTSTGQCYPEQQVLALLEQAGLVDPQMIRPEGPSLHALYLARKPGS